MHLFMEKISDLTLALVDRKPEVNWQPMKNVSTDSGQGTLFAPEALVTKEKFNKKVPWDKEVTNNEEGTKIVSLQSTIGNSEKKRENTKVEVKLSDNTQNSQGSDLGQGIKKETTNEPINKERSEKKTDKTEQTKTHIDNENLANTH